MMHFIVMCLACTMVRSRAHTQSKHKTLTSTANLFTTVEAANTRKAIKNEGRSQFQSLADGTEFRHELMLSCLDPLLQAAPGATWVTLGDVWGREAIYIHKRGGRSTATSLQDAAVRAAKKWGYIDDYAVQNAEALTYGDDSFDFAFMKEAFHHLARPYAGVYEMVRVARKAAILFEPADVALDAPLRGVNASIFHAAYVTEFEPCGFQFRLNAFEMVKTAMALNLPAIAFKGWNDPYTMPLEDNVRAEYEERLRSLNEMGERGDRRFDLMQVMFVKRMDADVMTAVRDGGYKLLRLTQFTDPSACV